MEKTISTADTDDRTAEMKSAIFERISQPTVLSQIGPKIKTDSSDRSDDQPVAEIQEDTSKEEIFDILSNQRRRFVLRYLKQQPVDSVDLRELSEHVTAWEIRKSPEQLTHDERRRVYTSLQQFHLPKMEKCDMIEYDRRRGVIEITKRAERIERYLNNSDGTDGSRSPYSADLLRIGFSLGFAIGVSVWLVLGLLVVRPVIAWIVSQMQRLWSHIHPHLTADR